MARREHQQSLRARSDGLGGAVLPLDGFYEPPHDASNAHSDPGLVSPDGDAPGVGDLMIERFDCVTVIFADGARGVSLESGAGLTPLRSAQSCRGPPSPAPSSPRRRCCCWTASSSASTPSQKRMACTRHVCHALLFFFNVFSSVVPPFQRLSPHDTPTPQVETIGDSYMAVTGALPFRSDHASAALRFALDLCVAASAVDYVSGDGTRSRLAVRVGLHTGPVTSGGAP